jgi:chromosome transmission fidelity protein 18
MDFIKFGKISKTIANKERNKILSENNHFSEKNKQGNLLTKSKEPKGDEEFNLKDENNFEDEKDDIPNITGSKVPNKNSIKRPIICICNDLYSKVLIQLRKEALVFNVKQANPERLEGRLKFICQKEKLLVDNKILRNIMIHTNYDIRQCLNVLQFISYNKKNTALIHSLSIDKLSMLGQKDIRDTLFQIWDKLFLFSSKRTSFRDILNIYYSHGDFDKINEGLYMNYPKVVKENELSKSIKLLDYLSFDDIISSKIKSSHSYELSRTQGIPGAYVKSKLSIPNKVQEMEFPLIIGECKKNRKINKRILNEIKSNFEENSSLKVSKNGLVLDILPFAFQIIQPEVREIIPELMNKKETSLLKMCVNTMYMLGLKLQGGFSEEGEDSVQYVPDIKKLLSFKHTDEKAYNRITDKQKWIVQSEYDIFKNIAEAKKMGEEQTKRPKIFEDKESEKNPNKPKNAYDRLMGIGSKIKVPKQNIGALGGNKRSMSQLNNPDYKFIYKYNEGVTNTVKRSMNISLFLK